MTGYELKATTPDGRRILIACDLPIARAASLRARLAPEIGDEYVELSIIEQPAPMGTAADRAAATARRLGSDRRRRPDPCLGTEADARFVSAVLAVLSAV